jgi:hypothetical protein
MVPSLIYMTSQPASLKSTAGDRAHDDVPAWLGHVGADSEIWKRRTISSPLRSLAGLWGELESYRDKNGCV